MKTFKYKLKLTKEQSIRVDSWINVSRYIYNLALETKIEAYKQRKVNLSKYDLMKQLTQIRNVSWINDVSIGVLQNVIERMDFAYQSFFKGSGFPKWAKKDKYNSISFKLVAQKENGFVLPKIGLVKVFKDRMPDGKLKTATIIKENNAYYLSVAFEGEVQNIYPTTEKQSVGLDVGVSYFLVDSNGCFVENPRHTKKYEKRLRVKQRSLSRKKLGSNSRQKCKQELGKLHLKIKNTRSDFTHKISHHYVKENSLIVAEKLNVKGMVKNHNLSKHIADVSWSDFFTKLDYKAKMYGKTFVQINPAYTSQKCNSCGHIAKENRISQSQFECVSCGNKDNADHNASKNILGEGIALIRQREALACA